MGAIPNCQGVFLKEPRGVPVNCSSNVTAWRDRPSGEYPAPFCGLTFGLSQVDTRLTLNSHPGWLHMVQEGVFWCWEWGRLWVRALEPCGKAALCYFCPWSRRVLQSWALCTRLPPSSFLGACAAPYVNPGECKLGGPHPGGSHHQPVAWAPSAKIKPNREGWDAAATRGANWQVSVSSRSLLSSLKSDFLPPKSCFKIFQMTACPERWWPKLYELGAPF